MVGLDMEGSGRAGAESGLYRPNESVALLLPFLVVVVVRDGMSRDIARFLLHSMHPISRLPQWP
jgi:hypothetical protein